MKHQMSFIRNSFPVIRLFANSLSVLWVAVLGVTSTAVSTLGLAQEGNELPLGAAVVIIETTDNDIELQVFVDGTPKWTRLTIEDPNELRILSLRPQRKLKQQGYSELFFASTPDPFPVDNNGEIDPVGAMATSKRSCADFRQGRTKWGLRHLMANWKAMRY